MTFEEIETNDTFQRFQGFSDAAREYALLHSYGKSYDEIFAMLQGERAAANDNRSSTGDEAVWILMSNRYINMLKCWVNCERDMVLTKLTYNPEVIYTLEG